MKAILKAALAMALVLIIFTRCSNEHSKKEYAVRDSSPSSAVSNSLTEAPPSPPVPGYPPSKPAEEAGLPAALHSIAAVENLKDSAHLFIRTADIKCKVQNVANATYQIEDITHQLGGYVSYTHLTSSIDSKTEIPVSADSSLQTIYYNVQNTMTIRVPNSNLDSALKAMTPLVAYLDFRTIKANNAALEIFANRLKQLRLARNEARLKNDVDRNTKKLAETTATEDDILNKQETEDNAHLANLELNDQVRYSTINLSLYQPAVFENTMVYNAKSVKPYQPGLLTQLVESAQFVWSLFVELFLVLVKLWPLVIGILTAALVYRKWKLRLI